jgi:hypothetical protein
MSPNPQKLKQWPTKMLWAEVLGKNYNQGQRQGFISTVLASSNGRGFNDRFSVEAFVEIVKRQDKLIKELQDKLDMFKLCHCGRAHMAPGEYACHLCRDEP